MNTEATEAQKNLNRLNVNKYSQVLRLLSLLFLSES